MADWFLLSKVQMRRIERYFPLLHGIARVDDRRIVSAIVFVIKNGLRWRDAPRDYGPHKTIFNRLVRWSRLSVFNRIFAELAQRRQTGADHDRRHASEGASHRCKPFKKGRLKDRRRIHTRYDRWPAPTSRQSASP
jgi:transposase